MRQLPIILRIFILIFATACGGNADHSNHSNKTDGGFVYYIGKSWSKRPFPQKQSNTNLLKELKDNIIAVTDGMNKATASYMGRTASGLHLVLTNMHVIDDFNACQGVMKNAPFHFEQPMGASYYCERELMRFPEVDLSIISLAALPSDPILNQKKGLSLAQNFTFIDSQRFLTAGFGIYKNEGRKLVIDDSDECRLISEPGNFHQMNGDSGKAKIWSMAVACDISIGDSGSPLIDKESGKIVGLMWSGVYPKFKDRSSFESIEKIIDSSPELVWKSYNYAVPVTEIQNYLEAQEDSLRFDLIKMFEKAEIYRTLFE